MKKETLISDALDNLIVAIFFEIEPCLLQILVILKILFMTKEEIIKELEQ